MKKKLLSVDNFITETARQPNEFTHAIMKSTAMAYKLIIYALYKTVDEPNRIEPDKKNPYCGFSKKEFCQHMGIKTGERTMFLIEQATDELAESFLILRNENARNEQDLYSVKMPWFEKITVTTCGDVCLKFNQSICDFFDMKLGYTAMELLEIGQLQSFYAMRYFGFAKSKSGFCGKKCNNDGEWYFELTEDDIRKLFDLKDKYKDRRDFVAYIIKRPCEEISEKTGLNIEPVAEKLGKGRYKWCFVCSQKAKNTKKIFKSDSLLERAEKREFNKEQELLAKLKKKHLAEWQSVFEEKKKQTSFFDGDILAEKDADSYLLEKYGK